MRAPTKKQEKFIQRYTEHWDAPRAYREAYEATNMKAASVRTAANKLLKNPVIKRRLDDFRMHAAQMLSISKENVLNEFAKIAFVDVRGIFDADNNLRSLHDLPDNIAGAIAGLDITTDKEGNRVTKYKFNSKLEALKQIAEKLKLFEGNDEDREPLKINITVSSKAPEEIPEEYLAEE